MTNIPQDIHVTYDGLDENSSGDSVYAYTVVIKTFDGDVIPGYGFLVEANADNQEEQFNEGLSGALSMVAQKRASHE